MELFEVLINELYFQGSTILNELRKTYFLDSIDPNLLNIDTKHFNSVVFIYSNEEDKHKDINDEVNRQELYRILQIFCRKKKNESISMREFMVKLFLTLVRNSNESFTYSNLDNIIKKFMTIKKTDYSNDDNSDEKDKKKNEDSTRPCIETLLKVIDVGLDKTYDEFLQDINILSAPIIKSTENFNMMSNIEIKNTPITEYRKFLKPQFVDKKKISLSEDRDEKINLMNKNEYLNIYETYKTSFINTFNTYFSHFNEESKMDMELEDILRKKRLNLIKDFRIKFVLIEEEKVFSNFIDYLFIFYNQFINKESFDDDFKSIWSKFFKSPDDFEINFILYIVPQYYNYKEIYATNNQNKNDKSDDFHPLLSEFLANNDYIYKNNVYLPWAVPRENELSDLTNKINESLGSNTGDFQGPSPDKLYSYIKQPLNLYLTDADYIFNLNIYKLTVEQGAHKIEKLFWKSIDIHFHSIKKSNEQKSKKETTSSICNLSMHCVDLLGIHYKDKDKERKVTDVQLVDPINIKIFNVFFRKDAPFNYNMQSNNGWLEVFSWGKNIIYFFR
jgi:hypothetical protein